jgi:hypothetical protein
MPDSLRMTKVGFVTKPEPLGYCQYMDCGTQMDE